VGMRLLPLRRASGTLTGVLEQSQGLSTMQLDAIGELERRAVAVDGGRLKLEWGTLRLRPTDQVNDLLWWDGPQLVGFLGLYCFDGRNVELAGMVDPSTRRHGIASALTDAALALCRQRGYANALLVVPRQCNAGRHFAAHCGGRLDHSEHALVLTGPPTEGAPGPDVTVRIAEPDDVGIITELIARAFGYAPDDVADRMTSDGQQTLVIEADGTAVGTLRVTRDETTAGVYGFAVDPAQQGRGIGRNVLRRVCHRLRADGVEQVGLEVATDNEHALGLYTSLGFTLVTSENYYAIDL
jgi:ribosomal protein S18 acetylase RimI-like enzyme